MDDKTNQTGLPICAVMVTYHPNARTSDNLSKLLDQVENLIVVDNGSNGDELRVLQEAGRHYGFELIENRANLGIAEALNQGVARAESKGFQWVILFDQDSTITDGFVDRMVSTWWAHPQRERVASIHPRYVDREKGTEATFQRTNDGGPISSWTSGALMPMWIFAKIGGFASDYFIDYVDHEYCLRIRAAGYVVADSREAVLLHAPGHPRDARFLWLRFRPGCHSPMRRYYITRNRIAFYRKYFRVFPRWTLQFMNEGIRETAKCFLGEQERASKLRSFLLGTWDGLTGRMGKREGI